MRRLVLLLLSLCLVATVPAQQKKAAQRTAATKQAAQKKPAQKKQATKKPAAKQQPVTVKGLQNQRQQLQKQMQEQERKLRQNERDVKARLQNLMIINTEIADKRRSIDTIRRDISTLDGNIQMLDRQLKVLQGELDQRRQRFKKSVRYMHRNRSVQSRLLFVFSADNFSQMFRRMRFMREYAVYQRVQGEAVQSMQNQVTEAVEELASTKRQKDNLLYLGEQEKKALEGKQVEQQNVVSLLQKQQKTIQGILEQQRQKDAALNAQIDKMIAEEIARAKARAEAERKKKAEEEARKKREEELARKKAAREAENARKAAAERKATAERKTTSKTTPKTAPERKATNERAAAPATKKKSAESWTASSEDRRLSGNFESNKGRFPMPITGPYQIVSTLGQHRVEGLKGSTVRETRGIELRGQPGAQARCIFDGEVSGVAGYYGSMIVIVRHGTYMSVYSNLSSVKVSQGQKVSARQIIGTVSSDRTMEFQLRRLNGAVLNPLSWLGR